jgi:hypothetical protein
MLQRVATTSGIVQPLPQAGVSADAAARPQLSAPALANLKAEVLLRLIETMLKHMPRTTEATAGRDLLETLLAALKTMPGQEGENARKLADIIAKLPPELRPSVEKLIGTVLSAMSTRNLIEIVRNPNGPDALKLAHMLATSLHLDDLPATGAERQQRPVGLTAQQLAAVGRHGTQQAVQTAQMLGDARLLQTTLKRIFDLDGNSKPRALPGQIAEGGADRQASAGAIRSLTDTRLPAEAQSPAQAAKASSQQPVEATRAALRHNGNAEDVQVATSKRDALPERMQGANAPGQALARTVLEAVARDVSPAVLMRAVAHLAANLSPEEATFLRTLLERPFDPAMEDELALIVREQVEDSAEEGGDTQAAARLRKAGPQAAQPSALHGAVADEALPLPQAKDAAQLAAAQAGKLGTDTTPPSSLLQQPATERAEALPLPQARDATLLAADATPEKLLATAVLREGVPLAFVPYLPAEEDVVWPESREAEKDEAADDGQTGEDGGEPAEDDPGQEAAEEEPETADMARRREKAAEMVGVMEPGLVFYQKLGDYWT